MPKQTFFNLPDEKRRRIIGCAVDEFARHGYALASISRLVTACGIAKGSFYQYFEDKEDLYAYVLDTEIVQFKLRLVGEEIERLKGFDPIRILRDMCKNLLTVFKRRPELLKISFDFWRHRNEPVQSRIFEKYAGIEDELYRRLIHPETERGGLAPGVDPVILAAMLNGVGMLLTSFVAANGYEAVTDEYLDNLFGKIGYILTNGIYS